MPSNKIRCISCSKRFPSHEALEHHLNHPSTSCQPWMDDVMRISQVIGHAFPSQGQQISQPQDSLMQDSEEFLNGDWELNEGVLDEPDPPGSHHIPPAYVDIDQHRDFYPLAA